MTSTMVRPEEDFQVMNICRGKVLTGEPNYVQLLNICIHSKNSMQYSVTTNWLTGLNCLLIMHYPAQPLPICGHISTTSSQTRLLVSGDKRDWSTNGDYSNIYGLMPNFACCLANMHQGWPKFVESMWMATNDNGLAL